MSSHSSPTTAVDRSSGDACHDANITILDPRLTSIQCTYSKRKHSRTQDRGYYPRWPENHQWRFDQSERSGNWVPASLERPIRYVRPPRVIKLDTTTGGEADTPRASSPFPSPVTKITGVLHQLEDDILPPGSYHPRPPEMQPTSLLAPTMYERVQPKTGLGDVYVQNSSGRFRLAPRQWATAATLHNTRPIQLEPASSSCFGSALDIAIFVQKTWSTVCSICFGLLGGVGLLQLLLVNSINFTWGHGDHSPFIVTYCLFAHIAPACFYILVTLCLISLYDWCDLGHSDARHISDTVAYRHTAWIMVLVYLGVLIITLFNVEMDDYFVLQEHNKEKLQDAYGFSNSVMIWKILDTIRCILAIVGWCMVATFNTEDLFLYHLMGMKKYEVPMNSYIRTTLGGHKQRASFDFTNR